MTTYPLNPATNSQLSPGHEFEGPVLAVEGIGVTHLRYCVKK